jgi:hypothetical protein
VSLLSVKEDTLTKDNNAGTTLRIQRRRRNHFGFLTMASLAQAISANASVVLLGAASSRFVQSVCTPLAELISLSADPVDDTVVRRR